MGIALVPDPVPDLVLSHLGDTTRTEVLHPTLPGRGSQEMVVVAARTLKIPSPRDPRKTPQRRKVFFLLVFLLGLPY